MKLLVVEARDTKTFLCSTFFKRNASVRFEVSHPTLSTICTSNQVWIYPTGMGSCSCYFYWCKSNQYYVIGYITDLS